VFTTHRDPDGEYTPATYREYAELGSIAEPEGVPSAEAMLGDPPVGMRPSCERPAMYLRSPSRWPTR
jgi:hypothetical protein